MSAYDPTMCAAHRMTTELVKISDWNKRTFGSMYLELADELPMYAVVHTTEECF
ncbi:MAG: hypothetical protein K1X75_12500 [Leptospirales bacterium]|nr:hypothetical protein [Leptospirales bacterium]